VLVDVGQVLASFGDAIVVVGGWVPDLLLPAHASAHIGSIDVDLALDAAKLADGRYAELLKLLLDTGRYEKGDKDDGVLRGTPGRGPDALADVNGRVGSEIVHLSYRRLKFGPVADQWNITASLPTLPIGLRRQRGTTPS